MFDSERAASLGVGFVFSLFVAHSECQFIDEISGSAKLFVLSVSIFYLRKVVLPYLVDAAFESPCLFIFSAVVLPLES